MARRKKPLPKEPAPLVRLHYIREWAKHRNLRQRDIVGELEIDKSNVSRWFKGALPAEENVRRLAALFACEEPAELFRHPDHDWMWRLLQGRTQDEQQRIRKAIETTIEAAFPRKAA